MKYPILLFIIFFTLQSCKMQENQNGTHSNGTIRTLMDFPSSFVGARPVSIWLPDDYSDSKQYSVIYMQDGQMLFDSTITWSQKEWKADETTARLLRENKIKDVILVGIYNNGPYRWTEYFPEAILPHLPDEIRNMVQAAWLENKPMADAYLKFITEELKPFIDQNYSTRRDPDHTLIMGSSMGGIISLYAICEYPHVFGAAACLSSHWTLSPPWLTEPAIPFDIPSAFRAYIDRHLPSPDSHRIYFDFGTASLDALYEPHQKQVDEIMARQGFTASSWVTRKFPGEDHSEVAWAKRLHIPLEFLLGKN